MCCVLCVALDMINFLFVDRLNRLKRLPRLKVKSENLATLALKASPGQCISLAVSGRNAENRQERPQCLLKVLVLF